MKSPRTTLKTLAADLNLSVQAVSLALRDQQGVSEATRQRVKQRAEALGYRADPCMRALTDYRTGTRKVADRWSRLALVHDWSSPEALRADGFYTLLLAELDREAARRGIEIRQEWLGYRGQNAKSVFRRLYNTGIAGVFLAPPVTDREPVRVTVPEGRFHVVTFGPEHLYPNFHTVQTDYYENFRLAWSKLREAGHRRIGLAFCEYQGWRTGDAWLAAYLVEKRLAGLPLDSLEPLILSSENERVDAAAYHAWSKAESIDAVITSIPEVSQWSQGLGNPPAVAVFNTCEPDQMGIDLNIPKLASAAFELLHFEMQRALVGRNEFPFRLHIRGAWVDPARAATRTRPSPLPHANPVDT